MTVLSVKRRADPEVLALEFQDGSLFFLRTAYLPETAMDISLEPSTDITGPDFDALSFAAFCYQAETIALRLIARAEQCGAGLSVKLAKHNCLKEHIRPVLDRLTCLGILDDSRFARLWLDAHISRAATSPVRLLAKLCRRGIQQKTAEAALKSCLDADTERDLLSRFLRKNNWEPPLDSQIRNRLKNEGFSPEIVSEL